MISREGRNKNRKREACTILRQGGLNPKTVGQTSCSWFTVHQFQQKRFVESRESFFSACRVEHRKPCSRSCTGNDYCTQIRLKEMKTHYFLNFFDARELSHVNTSPFGPRTWHISKRHREFVNYTPDTIVLRVSLTRRRPRFHTNKRGKATKSVANWRYWKSSGKHWIPAHSLQPKATKRGIAHVSSREHKIVLINLEVGMPCGL